MATRRRTKDDLNSGELADLIPGSAVLGSLDLVGTAEAAEILGVERARIGKWRRNGIVIDGERIQFPDPIRVLTTCATIKTCVSCRDDFQPTEKRCPHCGADATSAEEVADYSKLGATPIWWGDEIRSLAKQISR